jgi:regulatory protein
LDRITAIRSGKSKTRAEIFVNGASAGTVHKQVIVNAGLQPGLEISESGISELKKADLVQRCSDAALHFLSYRPRSEAEVKKRLNRRGFDIDTINSTITRLKKQNFINDDEFARYWMENRTSFNPKSRIMLKNELRLKGVPEGAALEAVADVDEADAAFRAGQKKARVLLKLERVEFEKKLVNYLRWRGFNYEIIKNVCDRLWDQREKIK